MTKLPTSKTALMFVFFLLFELCHGEFLRIVRYRQGRSFLLISSRLLPQLIRSLPINTNPSVSGGERELMNN